MDSNHRAASRRLLAFQASPFSLSGTLPGGPWWNASSHVQVHCRAMKRKDRDSNPGCLSAHLFSRQAHSSALPPFHSEWLTSRRAVTRLNPLEATTGIEPV